MRNNSVDMFAPVARVQFQGLEAHLRRTTRFRLFESYRDPNDQASAFAHGKSKAVPFLSGHQLGLAADFVPYGPKGWVWPDASDPEWNILRREAAAFGLRNHIEWDRPHVEHPKLAAVIALLKRPVAWQSPV